jgi:outer membrane protein
MTRGHKRFFWAASVVGVVAVLPVPCSANALNDLYRLAAQNDLTLQTATAQHDAAIEARPQAWASLFPQVSATGYFRSNRRRGTALDNSEVGTSGDLNESYTSSGYALNLSQTIFDWSAFRSLSAAGRRAAQAEAAYAAAQQNLIIRLVTAYFDVLTAQDSLRADQNAMAAFKQQLDNLQESFKSGVAPVTDVKNAQAAYDASAAQVLMGTTALNDAKRALGVIVGRPIGAVDPLREEIVLAPPNPNDVESWTRAAITDNPGVIASHFAAEAADEQASAAFGKYFPTLNAVGQVGGINSNSEVGNDIVTDYVGLNVRWNLFEGGATASSVRSANANSAAAEANYQLAARSAEQSARTHYDGVVNGIAVVNAASSAASSQQASVLATEVGFKVGIRTVIDVLQARQSLAGTQKTLAQARYLYLISLLSLKADVGQLTKKDLEDVDRLLVPVASARER